MHTGIGNHRIVSGRASPTQPRIAECPYCGCRRCQAPHVSTGIDVAKVGLFTCPDCFASEISYLDQGALSADERRTGWYSPTRSRRPHRLGRTRDRP